MQASSIQRWKSIHPTLENYTDMDFLLYNDTTNEDILTVNNMLSQVQRRL